MSFTKSMKKILMILSLVLTIGLFALFFAACGNNPSKDNNTNEQNQNGSNEQNQNQSNVITAAEIGAALEGKVLTTIYNGEAQAINVEQAFNDLHIATDVSISASAVQILGYKAKGGSEDFAATAPRNAGEYVAKIKIAQTDQNEEFTGTIDYTINKKVITANHSSPVQYDGQRTHSRMKCSVGIIGEDEVFRQFTVISKNVGVYLKSTHDVTEEITGADAANYEFTGEVTVTITPKELTGTVAFTKTYNGTTGFDAKTLTSTNGVIGEDQVLMSATASGKIGNVTIVSTLLSGADAANYSFNNANATGTITKATKSVSIRGSVDAYYYVGYLPTIETNFSRADDETYTYNKIFEQTTDGGTSWTTVTEKYVNENPGNYRITFSYTDDNFYEDMIVSTPMFEMRTPNIVNLDGTISVAASSTYECIVKGLDYTLYQIGSNLPNDATITIKSKDGFNKFTNTPDAIDAANKIYALSNVVLVTIQTGTNAISDKVLITKSSDVIDFYSEDLAFGEEQTETLTGTFNTDDYVIRAIDLYEGSYELSCSADATIYVYDAYSKEFEEGSFVTIEDQSDTIIVKVVFNDSANNPTLKATKVAENYIYAQSTEFLTGRGAIITGTISQGSFALEDTVTVIFTDGTTKQSLITGIDKNHNLINSATSETGEVSLLLRGLESSEVDNILAVVKV